MSNSKVFKYHKRFREGRNVNVNERQGAPVMKGMDTNVAKISDTVQSDRWLTCRMIADELNMSKKTVREILVHDLGIRKLEAKLMPQNLMDEQKDRHLTLCMDFPEQLHEDNFLNHVITLVMEHGVISTVMI
jgi:hypothetical protein